MSLNHEKNTLSEKHVGETHASTAPGHDPATSGEYAPKEHFSGSDPENPAPVETNALHQDLKGRHMQMIAM
jgi:amino acid permease